MDLVLRSWADGQDSIHTTPQAPGSDRESTVIRKGASSLASQPGPGALAQVIT